MRSRRDRHKRFKELKKRFKTGGTGSAALDGCPCAECDRKCAWREEKGQVVCKDFKKCKPYREWFGLAWRSAVAAFSREVKKR